MKIVVAYSVVGAFSGTLQPKNKTIEIGQWPMTEREMDELRDDLASCERSPRPAIITSIIPLAGD